MPRKKLIGFCTIEGCERPLKTTTGLCQYHYNKKRLEENPKKAFAGVRGHPLYMIWWERKQNNLLCWEWTCFEYFVEGVGQRPEGEFFLMRIRDSEPFGPNNFKWVEHLRRKPNETNSEWWARKLEARKKSYPNLYSDRNIKRKYGLTREHYEEKLKSQNYLCAICGKPEIVIDHRINVLKRLAVDHCHNSNKIRELLCNRCNTTLGKIEDNVELLQKMIDYLNKHNGAMELANGLC
jgi:hypothetical protein